MGRFPIQDFFDISFSSKKVAALRLGLLNWFEDSRKHLTPWKLKPDGTSPVSGEFLSVKGIWVAEVMLQQTKLNVVLPYWRRWMKTFPTLKELAEADEKKVLLLWQGLGYYSRARRLHHSSKILIELIGNRDFLDPQFWPKNLETWMSLPGIGRSTAGGILSSAFDLPIPILDGNVKRSLSRLIASTAPLGKDISRLWSISEQLLDRNNPRKFNQALIDLGATVCTPCNPRCGICPWQNYCVAYASKDPTKFPVKNTSKSKPFHVIGVGIVLNAFGEVLIDQRLNEGLLGGMWEFPGGKQEKDESIEVTIARELKEELGIEVEVGCRLISFEHAYSHKKLCFVVHLCKWIAGEPQPLASQKVLWVKPQSLSEYPFPVANTKMIESLIDFLKKDKLSKGYYLKNI